MLVHQPIDKPPTLSDDFYVRCEGPDQGLINSWVCGIAMSKVDPALATRAKAGELPVLPWKGGIAKHILRTDKVGALHYLAAWQGLRGEDLNIFQGVDVQMTCTRFGVPVTFTDNVDRLLQTDQSEET